MVEAFLISKEKSMKKVYVLSILFFLSTAITFADTINLPKTGQTICYNTTGTVIPCSGTGQDGAIQAGVAWPNPRFTDNGDDTMTDNLTGLMWSKNANLPGGTTTWQQALDDCNNLTLAGFSDWCLPNVNELESLTNASQQITSSWLTTQGFTNVQANVYWSSTTEAAYLDDAWLVSMRYGWVSPDVKTGDYYVWPVRSVTSLPKTGQTKCYDTNGAEIPCAGTGQDGEIQAGVAWPNPRFTDHGDGTVSDNLTGLMWTKNANNSPQGYLPWQGALDYVTGMNTGSNPGYGYTDWRLPNRNELHSLLDFSQDNPALPAGHPFTNVNTTDYYWSSTTAIAFSKSSAWIADMWGGVMKSYSKSSNNYVWSVRGGQVEPICTYSLSSSSQLFPTSGGTGSVSVTTSSSSCNWTAISNKSWITIISGSSGTGNGTVNYSVSVNAETSQRTGTITIAGTTFTVTQAGAICSYTISPTSQSFSADGGIGSVDVTTQSGCSWTAISNASWITITSGSSGTGSGIVYYTGSPNTGSCSRTGTIAIADQTFTVTQSEGTCNYSISPTTQSFSTLGGTGHVSVTTESCCSWTVTSNASWVTITSGGTGTGNGTVNYSVSANTSASQRTGTMTIAGQKITVNQSGLTCTYNISPTSQSWNSDGGTGNVNVTTQTGCSWTSLNNNTWITITSGSSGTGNGTVGYSVSANTSTSQRTGEMSIAGEMFTVTQEGTSECSTWPDVITKYNSYVGGGAAWSDVITCYNQYVSP